MTRESDEGRSKFREGFRLLGEAATELARQGLTTVERFRRDQARRVTEDMRRAGAEVLRRHGVTAGSAGVYAPATEGVDTAQAEERFLRMLAEEVYVRMTDVRLAAKEGQPAEPAPSSGEGSPPVSRDER